MNRRARCVFVGLGTWGRRLLSRVDGHFEVAALVSTGGPDSVRALRFDWVRAHLAGPLHEELLCHDLAVTVALTGELPEKTVVVESGRRLLRCRIRLPSGARVRVHASATRRCAEAAYRRGAVRGRGGIHLA